MILLHFPVANKFLWVTLILLIIIVMMIYFIITQVKKISSRKYRHILKFLKAFLLIVGGVILLLNNVVFVSYIMNKNPVILVYLYIAIGLFIYILKRHKRRINLEEYYKYKNNSF